MNCLFCKMVAGEIPVDKVYEDDDVLAFRDINPQAPVHVQIIPRKHIATLNDATPEDQAVLGKMMLVASQIAKDEGFSEDGYRTVMNCNSHGGQSVYHIHLHLIGKRQMSWPPG
ncbi:histidine triad nucleotide-binding protein [Endozoicomonas sp. 4G]|uniref:histidine triad nucleotide-binding protein n=1 Tax=Endozoicomonas sp. 4G TaxID=2872754 RepID=UPI002078DA26|nr:histidine triad nucleotide-binding protein [Endozoicomonas sp. 4G]